MGGRSMRKPDCFIEVYSNGLVFGAAHEFHINMNGAPTDISLLDDCLDNTEISRNLHTIAIFKIYLKNKPKS
jgi:hypothetical protein